VVDLVPHRDFEAFQSPDIVWYHHADFINQFAALTSGDETVAHEAAFTKPGGMNPGFINIATFGEDGIQITVRGEPSGGPRGDNTPGGWARLHISLEDWQQLIADVARLDFPGRGADTHAAPARTLEPGEIAPYDGKPYPTERDPLMQRTDPTLPDDHPDNEGYYVRIRSEHAGDAVPHLSHGASAGDPLGQRAEPAADGAAADASPCDVGSGLACD